MIKGCNKRVIVMKETGNAMIEEAIFILKSGGGRGETFSEADIIRHANSILDKGALADRTSQISRLKAKKTHGAVGFFAGALTGAFVVLGVLLFI